jgi:hypothetical protein
VTETVCDPGRVVHAPADRDRLARATLEICDQVFPGLDADDPLRRMRDPLANRELTFAGSLPNTGQPRRGPRESVESRG